MKRPKYSLHEPSGRARVWVHGKHVYLGVFNSPESLAAYELLCGELAAQAPTASNITLGRLAVLFMSHADTYYRKPLPDTLPDPETGDLPLGEPTGEADNFRCALKYVCREIPGLLVRHFGPKKLKEIREKMVDAGLSRQVINANVRRIRHMVKWAVGEELAAPATLEALRAVEALKKGKTRAPEGNGRVAVLIDRVEDVKPFLNRATRGLVEFLQYTGCRPAEAVCARWSEIDTSDDVWQYRPGQHKTEHHGKGRVIQIGPRAQQVLNGMREHSRSDFIFDPQLAVDEAARRAFGDDSKGRPVGDHYTVGSLRTAVRTACEKAFDCPPELRVRALLKPMEGESARQFKARRKRASAWRKEHCWTPGQLRHTTATLVRKHNDLETAQQVLGHSSKTTTERYYAEPDLSRARDAASELG